ncbi:MAG TPA: glycosyltransferase family 1 protein, partial [Anaerolineae bacterium]|nr:glycosyltransferase family 1 protein [Anaerolineae bacterium]
GKLDLFHSPDFVLPPTRGNIPTLLTVHDLSFVHFPHVYTKTLVDYLNKVVPWSVGRATHILADSQATKRDIVALWGTPADKVTVLYAAAGAEFVPVTDKTLCQTVRERYGLGDKPYLLAVGTVQPRKNYQRLIRAFRPIAANWPHNLVIAGGKGWLYDDILAEIAAQGLTGRVIFTDFVADKDLPALYSEATLFLMPSIYEGFGIPILEAMGCGVPVISSNASCLPEVVGDAGVLLSPDDEKAWTDTIHLLLLDAPRRSHLVGKGAIQARKFRWSAAARQLKAIYRQFIEK